MSAIKCAEPQTLFFGSVISHQLRHYRSGWSNHPFQYHYVVILKMEY